MTPRIETAEILSFRLKVPPSDLERLPSALGKELNVAVEQDGGELIVSMEECDSYLRFRPIGPDAMLTEVFVCNDDRGLFFQRVLGTLMVRYAGDLHIRLTWNTPERNSHGDFAEVRINRGSTTYPGLANAFSSLPPARAGSADRETGAPGLSAGGGGRLPPSDGEAEAEAGAEEPPLTPFEKEINDLLSRARANWDEYQRLKTRKK